MCLRLVTELVGQGLTFQEISRIVKKPVMTCWRMGHALSARKRKSLTVEQRELIECLVREDSLSLRKIARKAGVSKDTVRRIRREVNPTAAYPEFSRPKRCPGCGGRIRTYTCIRCSVLREDHGIV